MIVPAEADRTEATQVETAVGCVKVRASNLGWPQSLILFGIFLQSILKYVNKQVKWATNRQKLADYQSKMDVTAMEKSQHPIAQLFKVQR